MPVRPDRSPRGALAPQARLALLPGTIAFAPGQPARVIEPAPLPGAVATSASAPKPEPTVVLPLEFRTVADARQGGVLLRQLGVLAPDVPLPDMLANTTRTIAAVHEAGHAVMIAAFGWTVKEVAVMHTAAGWGGWTDYSKPEGVTWRRPVQRRKILTGFGIAGSAVVELTGVCAETIFAGTSRQEAMGSNWHEVLCVQDRLRALARMGHARAGDAFAALETLATETLRANDAAVRRVHAKLMATPCVKGRVLARLLDGVVPLDGARFAAVFGMKLPPRRRH